MAAKTTRVMVALLANAALVTGGVIVALLLFELIIFRFVLPAPDLPRVAFENGLVKYAPDQKGINRVQNEITATWRINANGWPSSVLKYTTLKHSGTYRIAVIGDSYIEGFAVEPEENIAERLQAALRTGVVDVYRFGISGAPMSQYLHMLRQEVCGYLPDLVVVALSHNDFGESYRYKSGVYASSFLKLRVSAGAVVAELPPTEHVKPWYSDIRHHSAIWRYLAYRKQFRFQRLREFILRREPFSPDATPAPRTPASEPAIAGTDGDDFIATDYVASELKKETARCGARLLLVIDGDRRAIYAGRSETPRLNAMVAAVGARHAIPVVDLHAFFLADYRVHKRPFNFVSDYHWNARGHAVAAEAVKAVATDQGLAPR